MNRQVDNYLINITIKVASNVRTKNKIARILVIFTSFSSIVLPAKTKLMISGISLTAYTPESNGSSDFALMILQRENGKAALYRYDRAEKTIQRFVKEDIVVTREEKTPEESNMEALTEQYEKNTTTMVLIIAVLIALWIVTVIGMIYFALKSRESQD